MSVRLQEGSGGAVGLKVYLGGALGDENRSLKACQGGEGAVGVDVWYGSMTALAAIIPEFAAFELPYLLPTGPIADIILDEKLRGEIEAKLEKQGLKLLMYSESGFRSIGTNFGFVRSTSDLKGKKMRSQQGDVHLNTWRALGGSPVPVPAGQVLNALHEEVIEGFAATPADAFNKSWYQLISHFTLTRHSYQPALAVMKLGTWRGLGKTLQGALVGDMAEQSAAARTRARRIKKQMISTLQSYKVQIHESTEEERAAFREACAPTHKKFTEKYGERFYKAITKHI